MIESIKKKGIVVDKQCQGKLKGGNQSTTVQEQIIIVDILEG